jgi:hypothetical protein
MTSEPNDRFELEADRVADKVTRMSDAAVERKGKLRQMSFQPASVAPLRFDLEGNGESLQDAGKPLPDSVRGFFEPRFGLDFSQVRVHAGQQAAALNRSLDARAFTVGRDIFFREGTLDMDNQAGRKLLAHELTHIVQQNGLEPKGLGAEGANPQRIQPGKARGQVIQRDDQKEESKKIKSKNLYFVIGDKSLNVGGGEFLPDLEALRDGLLKTDVTGEWTLTLTMHGAETFFGKSAGDVTGGLKETDPGAYNKSRVQKIFGDKKFRAWRDSHGPTRINLLSCQIGRDLEAAFLQLILTPGSSQTAVGLGEGCILFNTPMAATLNNRHIHTRQEYDKLSQTDKDTVFKFLEEANNTYGYNGKKVSSKAILDYYFDVAPEGLWVKVEILTKGNHRIPYLTRQQSTIFIDECTPKPLKKRQPAVPQVGDE